jgi:predicted DCC family thiol-disulfide oxidoreductase YuxK
MVDSTAQGPAGGGGRHLLLYDGVCGLCDHLVQFVLAHDARHTFDFAPLQSGTGRAAVAREGGDPDALTSFYVVRDYQTAHPRSLVKARAALVVARELGWPWRVASLCGVLPTALLDVGYDLVARYRYRVFGRFEQCMLPRPDQRGRFIDVDSPAKER